MQSRIVKPFNRKIFKLTNSFVHFFYSFLINFFVPKKTYSKKLPYFQLKRMNKIINKFYKQPLLVISATDNLIPMRIKTLDGVTIDFLQYITNPESNKWMVVCHWFAGDKYWALYYAKPFIELGYNIIAFDFRNHGQSDKNLDITMGITESNDLLAILKWLYENKTYEHLALMGTSMGAFVSDYVQARWPELMNRYRLKFSISDVTYGSIESLMVHLRSVYLSKLIGKRKTSNIVTNILNEQNEISHVNWYDIDIFKYYEVSNKKPIAPTFFSHGLNDKVTPPTDVLKIFSDRSKYRMKDEILIYNFSPHAFSIKNHFYRQVYHWLIFENKIINDNKATHKALAYFGITQETLMNNKQEKYEIYSYYINQYPKTTTKNK